MKKLNGTFDEKRLTTILSDNNFTETCLLASAILIVNTKNIRKYKKKKNGENCAKCKNFEIRSIAF